MVRNFKNKSGFTLVELLVVVAIIGILASAGIPQYRRFIAKAKQTEAKVALGEIGNAQAAFFSEMGGYGNNLRAMGVQAETNSATQIAQKVYAFGFFGATCTRAAAVAPAKPTVTCIAPGNDVQMAICNSNQAYYDSFDSSASANTSSVWMGRVSYTGASTLTPAQACGTTTIIGNVAAAPTYATYNALAAGIVVSGYNQDTGAEPTGSPKVNADLWSINEARQIAIVQMGF